VCNSLVLEREVLTARPIQMAQQGPCVHLSKYKAKDKNLDAGLYDYDEAQGGGRLHMESIMEFFQLSTLEVVSEGGVTRLLAFERESGLSLERFPDGHTLLVTGRAAAAAQPAAAPPGAAGPAAGDSVDIRGFIVGSLIIAAPFASIALDVNFARRVIVKYLEERNPALKAVVSGTRVLGVVIVSAIALAKPACWLAGWIAGRGKANSTRRKEKPPPTPQPGIPAREVDPPASSR